MMSSGFLSTLTFVSAIGCGVVAGVFFAFSTFVMKALEQLPPAESIAAMRAINRAAPTLLFTTALLGTGLGCAALVVTAFFTPDQPGNGPRLVGGTLYLGVIAITIACNVPLNDALARVDPHAAEAGSLWLDYLSSWTAWNHARTVAALAATVTLTIASRA